jgi:hypothetical protein
MNLGQIVRSIVSSLVNTTHWCSAHKGRLQNTVKDIVISLVIVKTRQLILQRLELQLKKFCEMRFGGIELDRELIYGFGRNFSDNTEHKF